ncbi:hypothetical protein [Hoylesella saccharolytica]|nr:hypothetical protein [Hoylesella saccharolytica]
MKQYIKSFSALLTVVAAIIFIASCDQPADVPPRKTESSSSKTYKMPDPEPLTPQEQVMINDVLNEYTDAVED